MSVDMLASSELLDLNAVSPVGQPCHVSSRGMLGTVSAVEADGTVTVALEADGTVTVALEAGPTVPVPAAGLVVLPQVGGFVEVPRHGGLLRGYWVGLVPPSEDGGRSPLAWWRASRSWEHRTEAASLKTCRVVSGSVDPNVAGVVRAVAQACALVDVVRRDHEAWKAILNDAACERADDQGWCSDFDRFMNDWGMQGRRRTYEVEVEVEVEVTGTVTIRVEAANSSDAEETVTREKIIDAARVRLNHLDYKVKDAQEA